MVDFQTQYRQHGYKYNKPDVTQPISTRRDLNREQERHLFHTPRVQVHDCRLDSMTEYSDPHLWEASMLSHGLDATCRSVKGMHIKAKNEDQSGIRSPDNLLYTVGSSGSGKGQFNCPRGIATDINGDILVADTLNHRVQRFNQAGIFKSTFGKKGNKSGEFNECNAVAVTFSGDTVVADRRNRRIQLFEGDGEFKFSIETKDEPYSVSCDGDDNIVVGTYVGTVEIFRLKGKLLHRFSTVGLVGVKGNYIYVACNDKDEVIVCNPKERHIQIYSYKGKLLHQFEPVCKSEGLAFEPAGIFVNSSGQILVCDKLNHTVNLYTDRGDLLEQLLSPVDDVGGLLTCAVGPEGHLVVSEFSVNKSHCVKIFRYGDCECHKQESYSSRFSSAANSQLKE